MANPVQRPKPYVVALGTIEPRKNLGRLFEAYQKSNVRAEVDLLIVGRRGWGELPTGAEFIEAPSDSEVWRLISGAAALVMPSLYEGFGLPILEAQAAGTPVLCSDLPVFREVSGGHASFFDPLSIDSMVSSLETVLELDLDLKDAKRNAEKYSQDRVTLQLRELYRSLGMTDLI
ncbi:glycosyltransferase family 4 protein [Actinomycetospora sp. NBC_00405]|uniref:glycosyltransferase family 4 protein n=1 Tax=Actinomycetospora sp. NBC_00405 TaxID=2975952 RepID=UPI002E209BD0